MFKIKLIIILALITNFSKLLSQNITINGNSTVSSDWTDWGRLKQLYVTVNNDNNFKGVLLISLSQRGEELLALDTFGFGELVFPSDTSNVNDTSYSFIRLPYISSFLANDTLFEDRLFLDERVWMDSAFMSYFKNHADRFLPGNYELRVQLYDTTMQHLIAV